MSSPHGARGRLGRRGTPGAPGGVAGWVGLRIQWGDGHSGYTPANHYLPADRGAVGR